jgi:hypothetical protein
LKPTNQDFRNFTMAAECCNFENFDSSSGDRFKTENKHHHSTQRG